MEAAAARRTHTYAEYLALEETAEIRHEFIDGAIVAMSGGTPPHALLMANVTFELRAQLRRGPCRPYSSDLRVRVLATGRATYADITVICGPFEPHPEDRDAATNPTVLVEVLSPSTEREDRGDKWAHYQRIEALRDYVLVAQNRRRIEHFRRNGPFWVYRDAGPGGTIELSMGAALDVDAIYEGVELAEPANR